MLVNKNFDVDRVVETIEEICAVSEFIDPYRTGLSSARDIERYLRLSKRRLNVVSEQFERLGYRTIRQEFDFGGLTATNGLFVRGAISDGKLLFVGHHDYRAGVGAEDNATALATMLEVSRSLEGKESRIIFASFDLEELGLLGSYAFVGDSGKLLQRLSGVIGLECLGSGKDVVICREVVGAKSDSALVSALERAAEKLGHPIFVESFDWFNSDHVPFAERGVRTVEVCSLNSENYKGGPAPNVNVAHSSLDVPDNVRPSTLKVIGEVLLQFVEDFWRKK